MRPLNGMSAWTAIVFPGTLLSSGPDYMELKLASKEYQFVRQNRKKSALQLSVRLKNNSLFAEILGDVLSKMKTKNLNARCEK